MGLRLPRRRVWRAAIYLVSFVLVALAIDMLLVEHWRKITPGFDTTRIVAPVQADGTVDYLAAVEAYFGRGVTPENNAAVPIFQALGRAALPKSQPEDGITYCLGMPPLAEKGDYYISYEDYAKAHPAEDDPDPTENTSLAWPITIKPATGQWIKANEKPLDLFVEASKRSHYFVPFNGGNRPRMMISVLIPHVKLLKDVRGALLTRAILRLEANDIAGFQEDIRAAHRLARLQGGDATLVGRVVAFNLEDATCRVERAAAFSRKLSAEQMRAMARELEAMGDLPSIADGIDKAERFFALDTMQTLATVSWPERGDIFRGACNFNAPDGAFRFFPVRYNETMRVLNHLYDGALAASREPTYAQRAEALRLQSAVLDRMFNPNRLIQLLSADWPAQLLVPGLMRIHTRADESRTQARLTRIALALEAHKLEKASYPASLGELVAGALPSLPDDVFSDRPFSYSRTDKGYTLYSVGPNMTDDGGKSEKPGDDVVARGS